MIALHGSALADTSTTTKHVSRYFRCRQSLAPWAQIILFLSGRRPGSFLTFKDLRMGEKIRATTIERPRHYLLIVYSAFLVHGVTASEKDFFSKVHRIVTYCTDLSKQLKFRYSGVLRAKLDFIVYPYSGGL
jgi:hypothetical protein